jgi:hypothetical protein
VTAVADRRKAVPGRRAAIVLATDGYPSCGTDNIDGVTARIQRAFAGTPSVPTYVMGVFSAQQVDEARGIFERFATAGGYQEAVPFRHRQRPHPGGAHRTQRLDSRSSRQSDGTGAVNRMAVPNPGAPHGDLLK